MTTTTKPDTAKFLREVASFLKDGENDADGTAFTHDPWDAITTLEWCIDQARAIVGHKPARVYDATTEEWVAEPDPAKHVTTYTYDDGPEIRATDLQVGDAYQEEYDGETTLITGIDFHGDTVLITGTEDGREVEHALDIDDGVTLLRRETSTP